MQDSLDRIVDDYDRGALSRRQLIGLLAAAGAGLTGLSAFGQDAKPTPAPVADPTFRGVTIDHIALNVSDVGRSTEFYMKHLGMKIRTPGRRQCFLDCGDDDFVALFQSPEPGLNHFCFRINGYDADKAEETARAAGLGPERHQNRVYFDDPDGIQVQVAQAANG